jgi:hypothetical protein
MGWSVRGYNGENEKSAILPHCSVRLLHTQEREGWGSGGYSSGKERCVMALLEEVTVGSVVSTSLIGLGLVIAAPLLLPAVGALVVPLAREVVKGGVRLYDTGARIVTTMGSQLGDLVAEARVATPPTRGAR